MLVLWAINQPDASGNLQLCLVLFNLQFISGGAPFINSCLLMRHKLSQFVRRNFHLTTKEKHLKEDLTWLQGTVHRRPTRFIPLGNRIALNEFDHIPLSKSQLLI